MVGGSVVYYYYLHSSFKSDEMVVLTAQAHGSLEFDASLPYRVVRRNYIKCSAVAERYLSKGISLVRQFFEARRTVGIQGIDIIHIGQLYPDAFMGWLLSMTTGRPFVLTVMGEDLTGLRSAGPIRRKLVLLALRRTVRIFTISAFAKKRLCEHGVSPGRILVLPPGFDTSKCNATGVKEVDFEVNIRDKTILLTVGRLTERKGQDNVLRALPEIIKERPDIHYVMAGNGLDEARLKGIIMELGLQNNASIVTDATNEEIAYLYKHCQLFIMPNRELASGDTEGFGIVFLEAGWWGKPVIGGRDGGVPDAVEDGVTGLLVDGNDREQLTNAILRLLGDAQLRDRMGQAGRLKSLASGWTEKSAQLRDVLMELSGR